MENSDEREPDFDVQDGDQEGLPLMNGDFQAGEKFESMEDFEKRLREVQDATFCTYYRRNSESIACCRKKGVKRHISEKFKYYTVTHCCIHGGKNFKTTSTGQRTPSTFQKRCEALFKLTVSKDGEALILSNHKFQHNHQRLKSLYQHLPQTRRLDPEQRRKVADLLHMGANKKKVKERIRSETQKIVTLKDLSNIAAPTGDSNNLAATVEMLETKYASECHIYNEDNVFKGLFFATDEMKNAMKAFPEFIGIDATFKLLNIHAPVYLMIAEDSEGCTEIVACCILITEDKDSMTWFLDCFKKAHSSAWHKIKCVMADKDLLERDVIKKNFPSASVLICIFHSLRTFNREITCEKLGITPAQRESAKEIFQKMVYCRTEVEYMALYERLRDLPRSIKKYFDDNWHHIKDEWTLTPNYMRHNFLNTTNNRIESLNAKVKSVVKRYSSIEDFVRDFFTLVACLHSERDHLATYSYHKTRVVNFAKDSPEYYYSRLLTGYSFEFVKEELCHRDRIVIEDGPIAGDFYKIRDHVKMFNTNPNKCDCTPCTSMQLPCRHIFALRDMLQMTVADIAICDKRWTRDYYYKHQRVFEPAINDLEETAPYSVTTARVGKRVLSQHEKYRKAALLVKDLSSLASEVTGHIFVKRMQVLAEIKKAWQEGCEIYVTRSDEDRERSRTSESGSQLEVSAPLVHQDNAATSAAPDSGSHGEVRVPAGISASTSRTVSTPKNAAPASLERVLRKRRDLETIVMAPAIKRKGRPKGAEKTTIGLPKRAKMNAKPKKLPFSKQREWSKINNMLRWFVDDKIAKAAVLSELIEKKEVEARPELVTYAILDEDVNLPLINRFTVLTQNVDFGSTSEPVKRFFTKDAWRIVKNVYKVKKRSCQWECGRCRINLEDTVDPNFSLNKSTHDVNITIRCDYCLTWYHLPCVSLKKPPKTKFWKCCDCRK